MAVQLLSPGLVQYCLQHSCIVDVKLFSIRLVSVRVVHPYSSIDTTAAWKKLRFILSVRSDFHMSDSLSSILLYGSTTWTLTKRVEKKLDANYTRMLRAILNNSWRQHHTKHQLYGHLPPITKTIQVRRTRHTGHC